MDELFNFCTDRQYDSHHLQTFCLPSDDEDQDAVRESRKRSRPDYGKISGGVVDKRRRPRHGLKKKERGRRFLDEDEGRHSDSSDFSR